jgi:hypothetical protein
MAITHAYLLDFWFSNLQFSISDSFLLTCPFYWSSTIFLSGGEGQGFNYHQKCAIQNLFDRAELSKLPELLDSFNVDPLLIQQLFDNAHCVSLLDTRLVVQAELTTPSKLRREVNGRTISVDILKTLFAAFLWVSLPPRDMHRFFDVNFDKEHYQESFWEELQLRSPQLFQRDHAVHFLVISERCCKQFANLNLLKNAILCRVSNSYTQLNNHGFLVILIQELFFAARNIFWEIAADIILFGEKHLERPLDKAYFNPALIAATTTNYISNVNIKKARFDLTNEGFSYKDCFVLENQKTNQLEQLIILQKNPLVMRSH